MLRKASTGRRVFSQNYQRPPGARVQTWTSPSLARPSSNRSPGSTNWRVGKRFESAICLRRYSTRIMLSSICETGRYVLQGPQRLRRKSNGSQFSVRRPSRKRVSRRSWTPANPRRTFIHIAACAIMGGIRTFALPTIVANWTLESGHPGYLARAIAPDFCRADNWPEELGGLQKAAT